MLYKYTAPDGIISLKNKSFKITPPNQFNDPYEFIPRISNGTDHEEMKKYLLDEENLVEFYEEVIEQELFKGTYEEFKDDIVNSADRFVSTIVDNTMDKDTQWQSAQDFLEIISQIVGVFCLTKCPSNILMWSHYASSHTGIVIGIEEGSQFLDNSDGVHRVEYTNERPELDLSWLDGSKNIAEFGIEVLRKKFSCWAYEEEVRAVFSLADSKAFDTDYGTIFLREFDPNSIQEVILGCRCSPELEDEVIDILSDECYLHVKLKKATLDPINYKINSELILD
ncbi:DUF2971 domain-containing protein [Vibrio sp. DW001]|uniref:DUF2971 domain-containing protein n=1 Tax=Vibrio sp. DW001 TaxID=2912315 RepID=UPI0023AFA072|nr:DUF2971 domain-containing protein [Vibrio sp. DW001]WED28124.1 DUF2971 domain-containing protein [Vibrio sp. DW001]